MRQKIYPLYNYYGFICIYDIKRLLWVLGSVMEPIKQSQIYYIQIKQKKKTDFTVYDNTFYKYLFSINKK